MKRVFSFILLFAVLIGSSTVYGGDINGDEKSRTIIQHVKNLNKSTKWNLVDAIVRWEKSPSGG